MLGLEIETNYTFPPANPSEEYESRVAISGFKVNIFHNLEVEPISHKYIPDLGMYLETRNH